MNTDPVFRQKETWGLLYELYVNDLYWRHQAEKLESRIFWTKIGGGILTFVLAVLMIAIKQGIFAAIIAAISSLVGTTVAVIVEASQTRNAKYAVERWSLLLDETKRLWEYGQYAGWDDDQVVVQLPRYVERRSQLQAREIDQVDKTLLARSEASAREAMKALYVE